MLLAVVLVGQGDVHPIAGKHGGAQGEDEADPWDGGQVESVPVVVFNELDADDQNEFKDVKEKIKKKNQYRKIAAWANEQGKLLKPRGRGTGRGVTGLEGRHRAQQRCHSGDCTVRSRGGLGDASAGRFA